MLPTADVALGTGTTLVNDALGDLLGYLRPDARVALVGPTSCLLPDPFMRRGVGVLGGVRVTQPDEFLDVLSEGGSGYHFFGKSAERVVVKRRAVECVTRCCDLRDRVLPSVHSGLRMRQAAKLFRVSISCVRKAVLGRQTGEISAIDLPGSVRRAALRYGGGFRVALVPRCLPRALALMPALIGRHGRRYLYLELKPVHRHPGQGSDAGLFQIVSRS